MSNRAPDLTGAWIKRVQSSDGRLTLFVEGVRRFGLLFGGHITFEGVDRLEGTDPRLPSGAPHLTGGMDVRAQHSQPATTVLMLERQTGPGEVDEPRFIISHQRVISDLRLRPGPTARAWLGFYPRPRDRTFTR